MRVIDNILYLEFTELTRAGIAESTIKQAKHRGTASWIFRKDTRDGRKVLVQYPSLKDQYKKQIIAEYGDPYQYASAQLILPLLIDNMKDVRFLESYRLPTGVGLGEKHIKQYRRACKYLHLIDRMSLREIKSLGFASVKEDFYPAIIQLIKKDELMPRSFPTSYTRLRMKLKEYAKRGAAAVIPSRFGNTNSLKLTEELQALAIAEYSKKTNTLEDVTEAVNRMATNSGLKVVTPTAIYQLLHKPINEPVWWLGRHGVESWKMRFEHHLRLELPTYRDALWNLDGTKLNFFYKEKNSAGMAAKFKINKLADVASEYILGWELLNETQQESSLSHYRIIKMAIQAAGHKPYQLLYDGQGGHTKGATQEFYSKLAQVHFKARPYNGQSKPIESLIGRFQRQIMKKCWFFTGQNVDTKALESKANMDQIMAHKDKLPRKDQLHDIVRKLIDLWNNAPHPKYKNKSRRQVYFESINPNPRPVSYLDMIELFWLTTERSITYRKHGIQLQLGKEKYIYEVVDEQGLPDMEFRKKHLNDRFYVKYDPEDIDHVRLYKEVNGDLRFVAAANTKESFPRAVVDFEKGTRKRIEKSLERRKQEQERVRCELEAARESAKVTTEIEDTETLLRMGRFAPKELAYAAEADYRTGLYESDSMESDTGKILE